MIITITFLIYIIFSIYSIKEKSKRNFIVRIILFNIVLSLIFLCFLQFELNQAGNMMDGTIGTDEYRYWYMVSEGMKSNMSILDFNKFLTINGYSGINLFLIFEYIGLKTSFTKTIFELKVINIVMMQVILYKVYEFLNLVDSELSFKKKKLIILLIALNGGMVLTSIRLFKDTLLLLILVVNMCNLQKYFQTKKKKWIVYYLILAVINNKIRSYSLLIYVFVFILQILINKRYKESFHKLKLDMFKILLAIGVVAILGTKIPKVENFLNTMQQVTESDTSGTDFGNYVQGGSSNFVVRTSIGVVRTLVLPTPFKEALLPVNDSANFFEGKSGKILEISWQIWYPIILIGFIFYTLFYLTSKDFKYMPMFIYSLIQMLTYSIMYYGGVQARWKLPLFVIFSIFTIKLFSKIKKVHAYLFIATLLFYYGVMLLWAFN